MANANSPFGLKVVRHISGGMTRVSEYSIASGYSTDIFYGDVVEMTGTGKNIAKAAAANADNLGVFKGCRYVDSQGRQVFSKYWPASTTASKIVALVVDDPNAVFEVQCDTLAEADIGQLVDIHVGTGSTVTGVSGLYANVGGGTATTNMTLRLLELKPTPDNAYGAYAKAHVIFVEHVMKGVVAGVGGI
jgi:hypothetical protein